MKEIAEKLMDSIWDARFSGADTEEKLTAEILTLALESVPQYNTQNSMVVINKDDIINIANELRTLKPKNEPENSCIQN